MSAPDETKRFPIQPPDQSARYQLCDGTFAARGDLVDLTYGDRVAQDPSRTRGQVIVIEPEWAWVQFPNCADPLKYKLVDLGAASPELLADFRNFFTETRHCVWPAKKGEALDHSFVRIAEALADYADEIRKRSGC